jgi:hypothetical protein
VDELDYDMLRVSAGRPIAEDDKSATAVKTDGHGVACRGDRRGVVSETIKG